MKALVLICATLILAACAPHTEKGVTVLTYASPYGPQHPFSRADRIWIDWIEKHSGGGIRIHAFWSGSLLSAEHSMTELRHGVADVGLITPIYSRGGTHLTRTQAGFYSGTATFDEQVALYKCLASAEPQFARELQGLQPLAVQGGNLPGIITRQRPVKRLEDLRGLRLRAPSELLAVLKDLGADPVDMPMGDVYSALAKGVLDGVVAPVDTLKALHFGEVARYINTITIPRGAYVARAMSAAAWTKLSESQRRLFEAGSEIWERAIKSETLAAQRAGEDAGRASGVTFLDMPQADQARFDEIYTRDGEVRARSLERYRIDGMSVFHRARDCARSNRDPTP